MPRINEPTNAYRSLLGDTKAGDIYDFLLGKTTSEQMQNTFQPTPMTTNAQVLKNLIGETMMKTSTLQDKLYAAMANRGVPPSLLAKLPNVGKLELSEQARDILGIYRLSKKKSGGAADIGLSNAAADLGWWDNMSGMTGKLPASGSDTYLHELGHHYYHNMSPAMRTKWNETPSELFYGVNKDLHQPYTSLQRNFDESETFAEVFNRAVRGDIQFMNIVKRYAPDKFQQMLKIQETMGKQMLHHKTSLLGK
jgi:hypothetical protein